MINFKEKILWYQIHTSFTKLEYIFHFTPTLVITTDYFCCVSRKSIPILVVLGPIKELQILQEAFQTKFLFRLLLLTRLFIGCICFNVEKSYYLQKSTSPLSSFRFCSKRFLSGLQKKGIVK